MSRIDVASSLSSPGRLSFLIPESSSIDCHGPRPLDHSAKSSKITLLNRPALPTRLHRLLIHRLAAPRLATAVMVIGAITAIPCAYAEKDVALHLDLSADGLTFRLVGDGGDSPWVLQHSQDGKVWEDLLFLDRKEDGSGPGVEVALSALPGRAVGSALFRAVRLKDDDPARRDALAARSRWRLSGFGRDRYRYEIRWQFSFFFWHRTVTVVDDEVVSSETIESQPPWAEAPELPTIDDLFDKIADARASDADTIEVSWHPEFGFPSSGFIDLSLLIADEEQSWTIESFSPLR
jgi:hypothetical protein